MKEEYAPYDAAEHLRTPQDAALYLAAALEEGGDDPAFIAQVLGDIARSGNLSALARDVGMSREGLYKALSKNGNPSFATILKVTRALGLRLEFHAAVS